MQNEPEQPIEETPKEPEMAVSLSDLIRESQQAEAAWAQVKARWKAGIPAASESAISLDQLIPIEFEQEIFRIGEAEEEEQFAYRPEEEDREPQELEIPQIPRETVEPPEPPLEPLPEKTPLEKCLEALRSSDASIRAAAVAALQGMGEGGGRIPHRSVNPTPPLRRPHRRRGSARRDRGSGCRRGAGPGTR
ncbi:hypothetical protein [Methanoculleus chikugoensis]|uniref:hypothetical protein n=1 Tax=Methanoculleus chikugoensis TaxID=118126 RepID=UPI001FB40AE9|nr:hypothetical protein [Methanoculleus chikugoensis]